MASGKSGKGEKRDKSGKSRKAGKDNQAARRSKQAEPDGPDARGTAGPAAASGRGQGEQRGASDRALQREQERARRQREQPEPKPLQPNGRKYPEPKLPKQHLRKPGLESELEPRPHYRAPAYRGAGKLDGKVALITGGDSGIGRSVAVLYAREGADVAIIYLDEHEDAEETQRAVESEGRRALLIPGDVSRSKFCDKAVKKVVRAFGRLDILVNNAAYQQHQKSLLDITDEQLERTFHTNIFGYFYMARAALRHMEGGAVILNTGSVTGMDGSPGLLDYAATKGAIHAFTKSLAQNLVKHGIRVNGVAPGPVWTPLNPADQSAEDIAGFGAYVNVKRPAQPEEIAPAYVFLAADSDSSYITGEVLSIFGGEPTN